MLLNKTLCMLFIKHCAAMLNVDYSNFEIISSFLFMP